MTDTERLVAFLLDRETERGIAAGEIHNKYSCASIGAVPLPCDCGEPERVIAESAARRQIIGSYVEWEAGHPGDCTDEGGYPLVSGLDHDLFGPCEQHDQLSRVAARKHTLLLLAQPFHAHPAFDPAWRLDQS